MASFLLLLTYILFHYFRPADFIPILASFPYMKVLAILLILIVLAERGKIDFFIGLRQNHLLAIIICLMFLSVPFAFHPWYCLFGTLNFCKTVIIFVVFLNLVDSLRSIRLVMWTIFLSTVFILYEIIINYLSESYWWRFQGRWTQTWDGNDLAAFLVTAIPLVIGLIRLSKPLFTKILLMGSVVSYLIGIVFTQSRGGFIGLLAIGACYILRANKRMVALLLIAIVAATVYTIMPGSPFERFMNISIGEKTRDSSTDERLDAWKSGLRMALHHPLFGVGVNCFPKALGEAYPMPHNPRKWATAHNSFILILAEVGIPALLCYLAIYRQNLKDTKTIRSYLNEKYMKPEVKKEISILSNTFEISLVGFAATAFFLSHTYDLDMFLITGFIIVLRRVTERLAYNDQPKVEVDKPNAVTGQIVKI